MCFVAAVAIAGCGGGGCGGDDGGTPLEANSGDYEIDFFQTPDDRDNPAAYENPLLLFKPADAVITSVTNISKDTTGAGAVVGSIRHTENRIGGLSRGPTGNCALAGGDSTTAFDNQRVQGEWALVACGSVAVRSPAGAHRPQGHVDAVNAAAGSWAWKGRDRDLDS